MSKLKKEMKELVELAKYSKEELVFQQKHQYKKFKAKYNHVNEIVIFLSSFVGDLYGCKFYKESIYWCKRVIQDFRICDKGIRLNALVVIVRSFYCLKELENALEYGKKYLEVELSTLHPDSHTGMVRCEKKDVLKTMCSVSLQLLKNQDAVKYAKETLKLDVVQYNGNEIEKLELLKSYFYLIFLQIEIGDFKSAKKIIDKSLTIFNLNSIDPIDVIVSMEEEGYSKFFPWNGLTNIDAMNIEENMEKLNSEFSKLFTKDNAMDDLKVFFKMAELFHCIGQICWQKHEIDLCIGEKTQCNFVWGHMALKIVNDILLHVKFEMDEVYFLINDLLLDAICMTLLLADLDNSNRNDLFLQLGQKLFLGHKHFKPLISKKNVVFWIAKAQGENDKLDVQIVMPFIEFCLKSLKENVNENENEGANFDENIELKVQLKTLKNSLTITNRFKKNSIKEESLNKRIHQFPPRPESRYVDEYYDGGETLSKDEEVMIKTTTA